MNWLRTAATQTLLEISVLGPAKSMMHNMNYRSLYLSKQLLFELNSPMHFMKHTHTTEMRKTPPKPTTIFFFLGLFSVWVAKRTVFPELGEIASIFVLNYIRPSTWEAIVLPGNSRKERRLTLWRRGKAGAPHSPVRHSGFGPRRGVLVRLESKPEHGTCVACVSSRRPGQRARPTLQSRTPVSQPGQGPKQGWAWEGPPQRVGKARGRGAGGVLGCPPAGSQFCPGVPPLQGCVHHLLSDSTSRLASCDSDTLLLRARPGWRSGGGWSRTACPQERGGDVLHRTRARANTREPR